MNIVITGASSGIGLRTAERLAALGNTICNISRNPSSVTGAIDILADLAEPDAARKAVCEAAERLGKIDVAIYCAGYSIAGSLRNVGDADIDRITAVNYLSAVKFCRAAVEHMTGGKILLVSSLAGYLPLPYEHYYCATKAALIAYARVAAMEFRDGPVQFCCLTPGGVATPFTQHRQKVYGDTVDPNLNAAVSAIADIEQGGMLADDVADKIVALLQKPKLPVVARVAASDTLALLGASLLPTALENKVMAARFGQRKPKLMRVLNDAEPQPEPEIIDLREGKGAQAPRDGQAPETIVTNDGTPVDPNVYGYTDSLDRNAEPPRAN